MRRGGRELLRAIKSGFYAMKKQSKTIDEGHGTITGTSRDIHVMGCDGISHI